MDKRNNAISDDTVVKRDLVIVYRSLDSIVPDPKNPRHHPEAQVTKLARSIEKYGFNGVVLIDAANNIISGHALVQAASRAGMQEVPTVAIDHLTPQQIKALKIALNRLAEMSEWNEVFLAETLQEIKLDSPELLEDTGFTLDEIDAYIEELHLASDAPDLDDQIPPCDEGPSVSEIGDIWLLNKNRLSHGDATKPADIERLMNGMRAAMCFTDSPYGVDYANSAKDKIRGTHRPILNDNLGAGLGTFLSAASANILSVTDGGIYMCMSSSELHTLYEAFAKAGGHWSTFIIWAKQTFTLGRADYQRQYEPILYGWREGVQHYWGGGRDQGDVWFFNKPFKNDLHPTMKPVELVMRAIRNSSQRGEIVLDPFLGSGTTLIAAERTGRVCYGMELDARYVDTAIRRWQWHTGDHAVHAVSGKKFVEIAAEKAGHHDAE